MFELVAPKTWKMTSGTPDLVPELVEEVARKGGSFLIFRDEYISITRAMENKALYEKYLKIAMHNLSEYEVATPRDKFVYLSAQHAIDLSPDGALMAADTIDINSTDLVDSQTYAVGSALSADSINIKSGRDLNITGSSIAATNDVMLDAGNNLNILAATSYNSLSSYSHTTESGFMSNGGLSFSFGDRESTDKFDSSNTQQSQNRSMVGSINGNLTLKAGGNALISGSDILAGQDINIAANDITINSGLDQSTNTQSHDSKQSGLTIAITNSAVSAAQTGQQMAQLAGQSKDPRIKALAAAATALAVANAASSATDVSVSATIGSSESHSDSTQQSSKTSGSTVKAGGNLNLVATAGKGEEGNGNITIQGSDIKAGNNISLNADNSINLLADKSTASQASHNSSSSSGAGVAIGTKGTGVTANAAGGRGNADGNDVTYTNTHLDAGNTLSIKSGGNTNLKGAVANGKQIIADIGGNLNIESLQDTSVYASKQESYSASVTIGPQSGGSLSASQSKINGNYASVTEQSGLKAGDGGFQIAVKGNTALIGAVIESSQAAIDAGNNSLTTASLTSRDIQNRSEYDAQSISISASTGGTGMPMALNANDNTTSTTKSGISGASITLTDEAKQKQLTGKDSSETIASLNRDVSTGKDTSAAIGNNLNVTEIQTGFTVTQAFVQQAGTFVANQAQKSDNLKAAGDAKNAEADKEPDPARKQQLLADAQTLYQQSADTKDESAKWGASGTYGRIATALTAAAGGNVTSSTAQLVQGAAVNYIQSLGAEQVKHIADTLLDDNGKETTASGSVRAALHAIVACAGGSAQGSDCGSAALGASASSLINSIMQGDPATMTAKEKENRTNLVATLVTGIAATTDASNIAAATSSAVMETENNALKVISRPLNDPWVGWAADHRANVVERDSPESFSKDDQQALGKPIQLPNGKYGYVLESLKSENGKLYPTVNDTKQGGTLDSLNKGNYTTYRTDPDNFQLENTLLRNYAVDIKSGNTIPYPSFPATVACYLDSCSSSFKNSNWDADNRLLRSGIMPPDTGTHNVPGGFFDRENSLGEELTRPVLPRSAAIDYIPSQYLCEFIKKSGKDGVVYRSSVSSGMNLALFDPAKAIGGDVLLYNISRISVEVTPT